MGEPTRILCVDGDPGILDFLGKTLAATGHRVPRRPPGAEGITSLSGTGPVHAVLPGTRLPQGKGGSSPRRGPAAFAGIDPPFGCTAKRRRSARGERRDPSTNLSLCRPTGRRCGPRWRTPGTVPPRGGPAGKGGGPRPYRSLAARWSSGTPLPRGIATGVADVALKDRLGLRAARRGEGRAAMRRVAPRLREDRRPGAVLNHPGNCRGEQFTVVKRHPRWGPRWRGTRDSRTGVVDILLHHHERFDGDGYPSRHAGRKSPSRPDRRGGGRLRRHDRGPALRPGVRPGGGVARDGGDAGRGGSTRRWCDALFRGAERIGKRVRPPQRALGGAPGISVTRRRNGGRDRDPVEPHVVKHHLRAAGGRR